MGESFLSHDHHVGGLIDPIRHKECATLQTAIDSEHAGSMF